MYLKEVFLILESKSRPVVVGRKSEQTEIPQPLTAEPQLQTSSKLTTSLQLAFSDTSAVRHSKNEDIENHESVLLICKCG